MISVSLWWYEHLLWGKYIDRYFRCRYFVWQEIEEYLLHRPGKFFQFWFLNDCQLGFLVLIKIPFLIIYFFVWISLSSIWSLVFIMMKNCDYYDRVYLQFDSQSMTTSLSRFVIRYARMCPMSNLYIRP